MKYVKVTTQSEFDAAVASGDIPEVFKGEFAAYDSATVRAYNSATVRAYNSATVHALDSATVRAYNSATVRAYGSATVRAYDSATVRAFDSATVHAYNSATVHAAKYVAVHIHSANSTVTGGVQIVLPNTDDITDITDWCDYFGIDLVALSGEIIVFKAVDADLKSGRGFSYPIGQQVVCDDWESERAYGNGLHFSQTPYEAKGYFYDATRFLACGVNPEQAVVLGFDKIKAPSAKVLYEVDIDGNRIDSEAGALTE